MGWPFNGKGRRDKNGAKANNQDNKRKKREKKVEEKIRKKESRDKRTS